MKRKRIILGAGQCGMKLALEYHTKFANRLTELIALSTSTEDSVGIPSVSLVQIATEGSGKKFSNGSNIWESASTKLYRELHDIDETDIIYFVSAGGGSGSSSIRPVADIVLDPKKGNRIFLAMVLPFGYENLPFKSNVVRSIGLLQDTGYADRMSIILFDNERLSKQYFDVKKISKEKTVNTTNLERINSHIVNAVSLVIDLINIYHDPHKFSPFTIDEVEHESVIFSNGFIGVDARIFDSDATPIKFDYGTITTAKNVIISKVIRTRESDYNIKANSGDFLERVKKISRRAKNARIMYGVVRTDKIDHTTYIIIANNLDITKYITKVKNKVGANIEGYLTKDSKEKVLSAREKNIFDI